MNRMIPSKSRLRDNPWFVSIVAGLIVLVVGWTCQLLLTRFIPQIGKIQNAGGDLDSQPTRDPWAYWSWSRQQIGWSRKWRDIIFYEDNPVILVQFKVVVIGDKPQDIPVRIPLNGRLMEVHIPAGTSFVRQKTEKAFEGTVRSAKPGEILTLSFSVRVDSGAVPFDDNAVQVFAGRASAAGWETFNSWVEFKQDGFLKWLSR